MASTTAVGRGRPRNPDLDEQILDAARQILAAQGYPGLSIDGVARAAGTTRPSVYLRFTDKADLATSAVAGMTVDDPLPVSDDVRADLVAELRHFRTAVTRPHGMSFVGTVLSEEHRTPGLIARFRERLVLPRRRRLAARLDRGVREGTLRPELDVEVWTTLLTGALYARHLATGEVPADWPERVVAALWPAMTDTVGHTGRAGTRGGPMTSYAAPFEHVERWTEAEFLALPPDGPRIELVDGSLVVNPVASRSHQRVVLGVVFALQSVSDASVTVLSDINVRVAPMRLLRPDIVVLDEPGGDLDILDAAHVTLVGEVTSPSNSGMDRLLKPQLYAAAGIGHYLRVDLAESVSGAPAAVLYGLDGGHYREIATAAPGEVLAMTEPFAVELDLAALARR